MLQIGGQLGIAHAVVGGSLGLPDGIAAQRQGLGGGQTTIVALNGIHQIARLVVNLEHSALQQRTGGQAVGGVVIGGLLHDLDLSGDGDVLPLDQGGFACSHIHRFHLSVGDIALVLQLPQVVAARNSQVLDVDIPGIVGGVLAHRGVGAVVQQEGHALDALSGDAVGLMDQYSAESLVGDREGGGFPVLYGEIIGGGVQLEALRRLDLQCVVAAGVQGNMDTALLVCGDGAYQTSVHAADLKGGVGDTLALVGFVYLNQLQAANGGIVKF